MVYCEGVEVESKLGKLLQAFRCDRPSEWQMDEFIRMAEDMHQEITKLREADKDAARYRWLRDESWGCDKAPPLPKVMSGRRNQEIVLAEKAMDSAIDEAMKCK